MSREPGCVREDFYSGGVAPLVLRRPALNWKCQAARDASSTPNTTFREARVECFIVMIDRSWPRLAERQQVHLKTASFGSITRSETSAVSSGFRTEISSFVSLMIINQTHSVCNELTWTQRERMKSFSVFVRWFFINDVWTQETLKYLISFQIINRATFTASQSDFKFSSTFDFFQQRLINTESF